MVYVTEEEFSVFTCFPSSALASHIYPGRFRILLPPLHIFQQTWIDLGIVMMEGNPAQNRGLLDAEDIGMDNVSDLKLQATG